MLQISTLGVGESPVPPCLPRKDGFRSNEWKTAVPKTKEAPVGFAMGPCFDAGCCDGVWCVKRR